MKFIIKLLTIIVNFSHILNSGINKISNISKNNLNKIIKNSNDNNKNKSLIDNDYTNYNFLQTNIKIEKKYKNHRNEKSSHNKQDNSISFDDDLILFGGCIVKYKGFIINLYPLSELTSSPFFLKYKSEIYDFNTCKDIYTSNRRAGLFVNRYKDIIYAGKSNKNKFFFVEEENNYYKENQNVYSHSNDKNNTNRLEYSDDTDEDNNQIVSREKRLNKKCI